MIQPTTALLAALALAGCAQTQVPAQMDHQPMEHARMDPAHRDHAAMNHTPMDHAAHMAQMAQAQRQAEVARRGPDVMPFSLAATTHVFTKTAQGGTQKVVAKNPSDREQVALVRQHLQEIRASFLRGDFAGPAHIHGQDMPGLAELQAAPAGRIAIAYRDLPAGAELAYSTSDAKLVQALHRWFDAQLADHGADAMAGHPQH